MNTNIVLDNLLASESPSPAKKPVQLVYYLSSLFDPERFAVRTATVKVQDFSKLILVEKNAYEDLDFIIGIANGNKLYYLGRWNDGVA